MVVATIIFVAGESKSSSNPFQFTGITNMIDGYQIIMDDSLVYSTGYHGIQVYSISDPSNIRLFSQLYIQNGGPTQYMEKHGDIIWATGYRKADRNNPKGSLFEIDVSDPANLRILNEYDIPTHAEGLALHGPDTVLVSWGQVGSQDGGVKIYDFSDPENVAVQTITLPDAPKSDIFVHGDLAFVGTEFDLNILDLSKSPVQRVGGVQSEAWYYWARFDVLPGDTILYAACPDAVQPAYSSYLRVVNIADPANPTIITERRFSYDLANIMLVDSFLLVGAYSGLQIFNISSPLSPDSVGAFPVNYRAGSFDTQNGKLFLVDYGPDIELNWGLPDPVPMYFCDISNLPQVIELGRYIQPAYSSEVVSNGDYCYVSSDYDMGPDVAIIDVSNPVSPKTVNTLETPGEVHRMRLEGSRLYVLTDVQMSIYDLTDPANPVLIGKAGGDAWDVRFKGEYALVAAYGAGLRVFDIVPPESTHLATRLSTPGEIYALAVSGRYLYASSTWTSFTIDIDNPSVPVLLSSWGNGGSLIDILPDGRLVDWGGTVAIKSLDDPLYPRLDFWYGESAGPGAISGDTLFIVRDLWGVEAALLGPTSITRIAEYFTPGQANCIARNGKYTYVADFDALLIFSDSDPTDVDEDDPILPADVWVSQNYPNPFNPTTTIEFDLDRSLPVVLKIYNALGRLIHTGDLGLQSPGRHAVTIDAQKIGMASGMYLYRVEAGRKEVTRKMMLVK